MARDAWFKCDPQDMLDGIVGCESNGQALVYVACIMKMYASGGPIALDAASIGAASKCSPQWAARHVSRLVEMGKMVERAGYIYQVRVAEEFEARAELAAKRALAGKGGGRPKKAAAADLFGRDHLALANRFRSISDANANGMRMECNPNANEMQTAKLAEIGQPSKAIAFHARARGEGLREESPSVPHSPARKEDLIPSFSDAPLSTEERAELVRRTSPVDRPPIDPKVDVAALTGKIMQASKMTAPPSDLVLVESWLALGADPERDILPTVIRMAAVARSPVRGMRYFDAEMRRLIEARAASEAENITHFRNIARRAAEK